VPLELTVEGIKVPPKNLIKVLRFPGQVYRAAMKGAVDIIYDTTTTNIHLFNVDKAALIADKARYSEMAKKEGFGLGDLPKSTDPPVEYVEDEGYKDKMVNEGKTTPDMISFKDVNVPAWRYYFLNMDDPKQPYIEMGKENRFPHVRNYVELYMNGYYKADFANAEIEYSAPNEKGQRHPTLMEFIEEDIQYMKGRDFLLSAYLLSLRNISNELKFQLEKAIRVG
jgi:hypothetical protein